MLEPLLLRLFRFLHKREKNGLEPFPAHRLIEIPAYFFLDANVHNRSLPRRAENEYLHNATDRLHLLASGKHNRLDRIILTAISPERRPRR